MFFFKEKEKHKLSLNKPALLIIDMQNYFYDKNSKAYLPGIERIYENIQKLKNAFLSNGFLVICTLHVGGTKMMEKWWRNIVEDEWGLPIIRDKQCIYIKKNTYDAFYNTSLENLLRDNEITEVVITGVMTHLCCETTARSAFVRGFNVVMVEDALWDKNEFYHFNSLKSLAHGFSVITNLEELLCKLE
ncbi:MAG: isochorismatase family protein [Thermosipho sp. (in: Bacteria)]|nr:isochorismatase family protein [Thermosipho sp. (in: thermotogales)]